MPAIGRRRSQGSDGDDDPQPSVGAFGVASLAHRLNHLARRRHGVVAVLRDQEMGGAVDVEIGDGREDEPYRDAFSGAKMSAVGKVPPRCMLRDGTYSGKLLML